MNLLKREISPILPEAWSAIDEEAQSVLKVKLAARKIVDVDGPHGWELGAVNAGRLKVLDNEPVEKVGAGVREVHPVIELRTPFHLELMELDSISRGLESPDLEPVAQAAERMAKAEDSILFGGFQDACVVGILGSSEHDTVELSGSAEKRFESVVRAWQTLQHSGVAGPYALAVGERMHFAILQAADDGYPIVGRIRELIGGPIVRADTLEGGALLSMRGEDFKLTLGQDLSIGYVDSDRDRAELFLTCSFAFQVLDGAAVVELVAGGE